MEGFDEFFSRLKTSRNNRAVSVLPVPKEIELESYNERWFRDSNLFAPEVGSYKNTLFEVERLNEVTYAQQIDEYRVDPTTLRIAVDDALNNDRYFFYHDGPKTLKLYKYKYTDIKQQPDLIRDGTLKETTIDIIIAFILSYFPKTNIIWGPLTVLNLMFTLNPSEVTLASLKVTSTRITMHIDPPLGTSVIKPKKIVLLAPSIRSSLYRPITPYVEDLESVKIYDSLMYYNNLMIGQIPKSVNDDIGLAILLVSSLADPSDRRAILDNDVYRGIFDEIITNEYRDEFYQRINDLEFNPDPKEFYLNCADIFHNIDINKDLLVRLTNRFVESFT